MKKIILYIRTALFFIFFVPVMFLIPAFVALFRFALSRTVFYNLISSPAAISTFLLRLICGIKVEIIGLENLPQGNFVALAKHQSDWETYCLQRIFRPVSTIVKQELLKIPLFGWGLASTNPIAIDRGNPRKAMKDIIEQGKLRLQDGNNVIIYPEGTRVKYGEKGKYARSGAALAIAAGVPILPVAHNAGACWPGKEFIKYPGTITVVIGPPIDTTDGNSKALTDQVEEWIETQQNKFYQDSNG